MRKFLLFLSLVMTGSFTLSAQNLRVAGHVTGPDGSPVAGAMVVVSGTNVASITGADGQYTISAPLDGTLDFSLLGMVSQQVAISGRTTIDVTMAQDAQQIEELVVVGYGVQKKVNLTGSVTQVDSEVLQSRPIQNVSSALQGLMPGLTVMSGQGKPGQDGATLYVRGRGTLSNSDPYILIDGIQSSTMNELDPNDIESISVLKDAASAAIYGSKAANGVILITTKRGKVGAPQISYSGDVSFSNAASLVERMGSAEYATLYNKVLTDAGKSPRWSEEAIRKFTDGSDPDNYPDTDWYGLAFKTGVQHKHNVNVSGGTDNVRYMASAGYMHQDGILAHSNREQFQARTNLDVKLNERLNARMNLSYVKNDYSEPSNNYVYDGTDQIIRQLNVIAPWIPYKYKDATDGKEWYGSIGDGNPLAWLETGQTIDRRNQNFSGIASLDYKLAEGLVATATGGYVSDIQHYKAFHKYFRYNPSKETQPTRLDERYYTWNRSNFDLLLNYDKTFGSHNLKVMAGWHVEKYNSAELRGYREGFPNNELTDMNAGKSSTQTNSGFSRELAMVSGFGRINYDYAGKYLFEADFRADASSRFKKENRWGYFPSLSAGWRVSEEGFMQGTRGWLQNLKLRGSWGMLGNQEALDDRYYPWMSTYNLGGSYPIDGTVQTGYYQSSFNLSTISWEKVRSWGIGIDVTLLKKFDIVLDYYDKSTTGILMTVAVPTEFGLGGYTDNVGGLTNKGFEMSVGYNDRWGDWRLGANANFSYNKNTITALGRTSKGETKYIDGDGYRRHTLGHSYNSYFVYQADGFFASDEEAKAYMDKYAGQSGYPFAAGRPFKGGDLRYADTNNDGKITSDDRVYANSNVPKTIYGLNLTLGWKNLDLSMAWSGTGGAAYLYSGETFGNFNGDAAHPSTLWRDSWTFNKENPKLPRIFEGTASESHPQNVSSTFWLQNTSFIRLKNLQLGYSLPTKWLEAVKISRVRVYYSAENLLTFDHLPINLDPETNSERMSSFPLIKSHAFGLNITF